MAPWLSPARSAPSITGKSTLHRITRNQLSFSSFSFPFARIVQANIAVQGFEPEFRSACSCASHPETAAPIDVLAVLLLGVDGHARAGRDVEIRVNLPVHGLEREVRLQPRLQIHIYFAVDRFKT